MLLDRVNPYQSAFLHECCRYPKYHAHGCDFHCSLQSNIDASKLEPICAFAELLPTCRETGWYADLEGHEILNARVFANISDKRPGPWAPEYVQDNWNAGWTAL